MALNESELQHLKSEAAKLYTEYGRLKKLHRQDRSNQEVEARLKKIRGEYELISQRLENVERPDKEPPAIDMSHLEPTPFKAKPPVHISRSGGGNSSLLKVLNLIHPRTLASILALIVLASILMLIFSDDLGFYVVPSSSMEPTLLPGDRLIAFSQEAYRRGDVVVLYDEKNPGAFLVKRVVALEGDSVTINRGVLSVNGKSIEEPYIKERIGYRFGPLIVPADQAFLLGDNRNASEDGHIWKRATELNEIVGAVRYIYAPGGRRRSLADHSGVFSNP